MDGEEKPLRGLAEFCRLHPRYRAYVAQVCQLAPGYKGTPEIAARAERLWRELCSPRTDLAPV